MSWARGQRIGSYDLVRRLGRGGFAEVWLAEHRGAAGFRSRVAVKLVVPDPESGVRTEALLREARLTSWINDPHVVAVHRVEETDDVLLLAMEYCDGGSLSQLLRWMRAKSVPMPPSVAVDIGLHVARALVAAHKLESPDGEPVTVVHRDLKPGNVLLTRAGYAKVCDFGIAKAQGETNVTETGMIKGTTAYIAPELWEDTHAYSPASDLFALGTLLVEMVTLDRLHGTGSMAVAYRHIVDGDATEDALKVAPFLPPLVPLVSDLLARDPADRIDDAQAVVDQLVDVRRQLPGSGDLQLAVALFEEIATAGGRSLPPLPSAVDIGWQELIFEAIGTKLPLVPGPSGQARLWQVASIEEETQPVAGVEALGPRDRNESFDSATLPFAVAAAIERTSYNRLPTVKPAASEPTTAAQVATPEPAAAPAPAPPPFTAPATPVTATRAADVVSSATLKGVPRRGRRKSKKRVSPLVVALALFGAMVVGTTAGMVATILLSDGDEEPADVVASEPTATPEVEQIARVIDPEPVSPTPAPTAVPLPPDPELAEADRPTPTPVAEPDAPPAELAPLEEPATESTEPAPVAAALPKPCVAVASRPTGAFVWFDGVLQRDRARSSASHGRRVDADRLMVSMALAEDGVRGFLPLPLADGESVVVRCDLLGEPSCSAQPADASLCAD